MSEIHLRKYGVEFTVDFDLFEVDGVDFRVDAVHASGDTTIMKDEGAEASTSNGFTDEGTGYSLVVTATEAQAARIVIYAVDQTATKVWLDRKIIVETYGNASAQHAFDLDTASVPQTADHTSAIAAIPTTAMRGTDSAALASVCTETRLQALTDWLNGGRLDLLLDAIPTTAMRGTDSAALASVCTETRLQALTDWLNGGRLDLLLDAIPTTAMRGTDSAALASVCTETRLQALTDWLNGGRLDLLLDAIPTTAMRGTDGANTVVPDAAGTAPTLAQIQTTALTESYAANGVAPTQNQLLYAVHQMLMEFAIAGTSLTVKKLDSSTTAFVVTLDDATNPTSATR